MGRRAADCWRDLTAAGVAALHGVPGFNATEPMRTLGMQRRREAPSAARRCYAAPDSSKDSLRTSTILPVTPPSPSNSCACLASARGNRRAMSGLILFC